jgi:hypothetical protein
VALAGFVDCFANAIVVSAITRKGNDAMPRSLIAICLLAVSTTTPAIIMRHDVDDAAYRELGERHRMTVVDVAVPGGDGVPMHGNGAGTLIAPQWVLTAAHVATGIKPGYPTSRVSAPHTVHVDGKPFLVEQVILHPDWKDVEGPADIALLRLAEPVPGAQPACLYSRDDEVGQVTVLVGRGSPGNGLVGPTRFDAVLRGATVRIDAIESEGAVLAWPFRAPDDPEATPLEGISGPGDSGGPAFLMLDGQLCVAGVSSRQDHMGLSEGRYTVREFYPRVSHFLPWLTATIAAAGEPAVAPAPES